MISCTDFIPLYSELFKFIEQRSGYAEVQAYWRFISQGIIQERLGTLVAKAGLMGCYTYWSGTLNEEAADFTMTLDEDAGVFEIFMHQCPSKGRLLQMKDMKPYHAYCKHCDLYRNVLEPFGYVYELDLTNCDHAQCKIRVLASDHSHTITAANA